MSRRLLALVVLGLAVAALVAWRGLPGGRRPPNVVLICIDGCRADHLGAYGYKVDTSPVVDRLSREGVTFLNNYAQANESLFSHASLFSSRYPSEIGPLDYMRYRIPPDLGTLPRLLKGSGYRTGAFTGGGHIEHSFGFDQGFDIYTDSFAFDGYAISEPKAIDWVKANLDQPLFVFLHGYDAHRPYNPPSIFRHLYGADYKGDADRYLEDTWVLDRVYNSVFYPDYEIRQTWTGAGQRPIDPQNYIDLPEQVRTRGLQGVPLQPADVGHIIDHYDSSITYADTWIGVFLAQLADLGLDASNTLVIVLADHGEDLMEHGYFNHRIGLQRSNLQVPLIFWGAGVSPAAAGRRWPSLTANLDVAPTVLSLLGLALPPSSRGQDLAPVLRGEAVPEQPDRVVFAQGILGMSAVITRDHELTCAGAPSGTDDMVRLLQSDAGAVRLYDLRTDPGQQEPLEAGREPATVEALRKALVGYEQAARCPEGVASKPIDPALQRSLRRHGYW